MGALRATCLVFFSLIFFKGLQRFWGGCDDLATISEEEEEYWQFGSRFLVTNPMYYADPILGCCWGLLPENSMGEVIFGTYLYIQTIFWAFQLCCSPMPFGRCDFLLLTNCPRKFTIFFKVHLGKLHRKKKERKKQTNFGTFPKGGGGQGPIQSKRSTFCHSQVPTRISFILPHRSMMVLHFSYLINSTLEPSLCVGW